MPASTPDTIFIERHFNAPAEQVFDAWLSPETNSQWLFNSGGQRITSEMDVRAGGTWLLTDRFEGKDYTACGDYLEISRPNRLVFTFKMPHFSPNSDRITVEIASEESGCKQTFRQRGADIASELIQTPFGQASGTEQGWLGMFNELEQVLAKNGK